ncbi:MAG TPA: UDP-N-acetylglucosamine pyrophosphorylase [Chlorobaculum sp.]|uniref:UDP-N-acetylglucosamine pyrophosphorylase, putative n=1 Tax=Chlorobaculum tepidum (strain ATCC 49652 / DSM 12025 / NBRC 103806 / TLS) TaxID=194439 RepID=Q8KFS1_CHLTE|nr:sugar phosphate nucleotidyltransferase [Chlorobaculum tepidum]AAM71497.1 UDP-N-acetylglucosamine pyrophosphorylase, putative [Chlorobaculum tepidum TLS]HBU23725.1 UDP-N-acetylglucosamine pyrophosphorylase [Chlorobaculum sp.]
MSLAIVIMAAGKGTRMKSALPKVLHEANGKPLVAYVIEKSQALDPDKIVLIIGHQAELVRAATAGFPFDYALQEPQLGTGHAIMQAEPFLKDFSGEIIILSGDAPLFTGRTLRELIDFHRSRQAVATVLTAEMDDPTGYGRIIRSDAGEEVLRIVEQKDATEEEKAVTEINSGVYVFNANELFSALHGITNKNAQGEYYLTDVFGICFGKGKKVCAFKVADANEIRGINTPEQLREAELLLQGEKYC